MFYIIMQSKSNLEKLTKLRLYIEELGNSFIIPLLQEKNF